MAAYVSLKKAVEITDLHPHTLRKYADRGDIPSYRLPNGDRRFDVSQFECKKQRTICYSRVSTTKQKSDLDRQNKYLISRYPNAEVITDIGSGLNFKRKGLKTLLEHALQGDSVRVVVTYKDRIARFGFDLIEWIITRAGGEIVVLNQIETSPVEEVTKDLMAIITVFSSRLHGLRSNKIKKDLIKANEGTENKV